MSQVINICDAQGSIKNPEGLSKALGDRQIICSVKLLEELWEQRESTRFLLLQELLNGDGEALRLVKA